MYVAWPNTEKCRSCACAPAIRMKDARSFWSNARLVTSCCVPASANVSLVLTVWMRLSVKPRPPYGWIEPYATGAARSAAVYRRRSLMPIVCGAPVLSGTLEVGVKNAWSVETYRAPLERVTSQSMPTDGLTSLTPDVVEKDMMPPLAPQNHESPKRR